jgi:shikimate kinase
MSGPLVPACAGRPNLVLCGFMASGKTTLGRLLAAEAAMQFLDTDAWIEYWAGRTVARVFADFGEPYFRMLERRAVAHAAGLRDTVIATGGGVPLDPDSVGKLRLSGILFFVDVRPELLARRLGGDGSRPLGAHLTTSEAVAARLAQRQPYYDAIPNQVRAGDRPPAVLAAEILARYRELSGT